MDLPQVTSEQRKRFEAEYLKLLGRVDANARATNIGPHDRTEGENIWCLGRAYSEQLQLKPYPCQQCGAHTVNIAEPPDVDLECPKCGWKPVEIQVLASASNGHQPRPEMSGGVSQSMPIAPGGYPE